MLTLCHWFHGHTKNKSLETDKPLSQSPLQVSNTRSVVIHTELLVCKGSYSVSKERSGVSVKYNHIKDTIQEVGG